MAEYMANWDKTKKRFEAFWQGEIVDRCMVSVFAPKKGAKSISRPYPTRREDQLAYWFDGEVVLKRYLEEFENTYFAGDAMPRVWVNTGAAGHADFFKGSKFDLTSNTVWFEPFLHDIEKNLLVFDPESYIYKSTEALARYLVAEARGRYFVSMPDNGGDLDALAHIRGNENLLMDMVENQDWVKASLETIKKAWLQYTALMHDITFENNDGGSSVYWLHTWGPQKHGQLQSDISVMFSEDTFGEFVMPELQYQCDWFDYPLYHLDGVEQIRHLDYLLSIEKLKAIQWTPVYGQPSQLEYIPVLKRIQEAGKNLIMLTDGGHSLDVLMENLSSKGLYFIINAPSEDDARDIVKKVEKLTRE